MEETVKMDFNQTIEIQPHSRQPNGLRSAVKSGGSCRIYLAHRYDGELKNLLKQLLKDSKSLEFSDIICVYFLRAEGTLERKLEIGETTNLKHRLYNRKRDKWWTQIVIVSSTNDTLRLDMSDIKYLEAKFIQKAAKANKYIVENKTCPLPERIPLHSRGRRNTLDKLYEETLYILPMIGIDDFIDPHQANTDHAKSSKPSTGPLQSVGVNKTRERADVPQKTTQKQNHASGPYVLKFDGGKACGKMHKDNKRFIVLTDSHWPVGGVERTKPGQKLIKHVSKNF